MHGFVQVIVNGLLIGGIYAIVSIGLNLIFGVMNIINFAQGEFLMAGMYGMYLFYSISHEASANIYYIYVFVLPALLLVGIIGAIIYKTLVKFIVGKRDEVQILVTVGLSMMMQGLAQVLAGGDYLSIPGKLKSLSWQFGGIFISIPSAIGFLGAIVSSILFYILLAKTTWGQSVRATAESWDVSSLLGINHEWIFLSAFTVGTMLAGLGGALLSTSYYIFPSVGQTFVVIAFLVVVISGLGNIMGALIGGLLIGVIQSVTASYISVDFSVAAIYVLYLVVLAVKPNGLFGGRQRIV